MVYRLPYLSFPRIHPLDSHDFILLLKYGHEKTAVQCSEYAVLMLKTFYSLSLFSREFVNSSP